MSPGLHLGSNADDAVVIEILQSLVTDIGYITSDFLRSKLGVACGACQIPIDVNGGVDILLDHCAPR